jgi:protoporphyrinogen oxidase
VEGAPQDVLRAVERLGCTSCVLVNIGMNNDEFTKAHWTYFYDMDYSFTRLSFPHNLSKSTCPDGCGAIQAEVYFSHKYKPMVGEPNDYIEPVIRDLKRCGLIKDDNEIIFQNATYAEYANVIFDLERAENLAIVHGYLDEVGIRYCGRYGDWGYMWTDDSFKSGEDAAQSILDEASS